MASSNITPHHDAIVCVLEDDPIMMTIVRDCLQSQGYVVRCAETIEQMDLLLSHPLDLIISDIHVPDGNGLIHCIERKQAWSLNCPIIAITASRRSVTRSIGAVGGA